MINIDKNICIFASSSNEIDNSYFKAASELGELIGKVGNNIIHGGGKIGLMGSIAQSVQANGGKVLGIIPERLNVEGVASETDDETIVTDNMRERKLIMKKLSNAFIVLPGGFGTLEEVMEVLTLKQLKYHAKPIVFLNTNGFYSELLSFFEKFYSEKFALSDCKKLYYIATNPHDAMNYIKHYQPTEIDDKRISF